MIFSRECLNRVPDNLRTGQSIPLSFLIRKLKERNEYHEIRKESRKIGARRSTPVYPVISEIGYCVYAHACPALNRYASSTATLSSRILKTTPCYRSETGVNWLRTLPIAAWQISPSGYAFIVCLPKASLCGYRNGNAITRTYTIVVVARAAQAERKRRSEPRAAYYLTLDCCRSSQPAEVDCR